MDTVQRPYLTIREIAQRWRRNPTTVRRALNSTHKALQGYQSPDTPQGVWMITAESVINRWGLPQS